MSQIWSVAKKELRSFFLSPVAFIFLATFLFVVLLSFFWVDTFFARNLADIRPLFHWFPLLLVFLVSALTMRLWSDEQRMGTMELLFTLPVRLRDLVLGKFLAGLLLVAVALLLTIGLPITVSFMGDLDWGPVIGGYVGALLLAGAYLSVGLCVSSATINPIVSLIVTVVCCGALYLLGSDTLTSFVGYRGGDILRGLGTGSRFNSIQRGVIDLRDVLYYLSLIVGFLVLNAMILSSKRWSQGDSTKARRLAVKYGFVLTVANLIVLNLWASQLKFARVDLTERKQYSVSKVTKSVLKNLDAPLLLRGYFSGETHPLLNPLIPQVRDRLTEYGIVGGSQVQIEFVDPEKDVDAEKEAKDAYGINSVPFQTADRHQMSVKNAYFSVLVKYGNKHAVLGFDDLIEVKGTGMKMPEVRLRNLEYDLTRTIKRTVADFQPLEDLFAQSVDPIVVEAYVSPESIPENIKSMPTQVAKVIDELKGKSGGKLSLKVMDPTAENDSSLPAKIEKTYGFKPFLSSPFGGQTFYMHYAIRMGEQIGRFFPSPGMSEADIRKEFTGTLKRMTPGFLKRIGLVVATGKPQRPAQPGMPPMPSERYRFLKSKLGETYDVKGVDLSKGRVPADIDVLAVIGKADFSENAKFAMDQHLMRGGALILGYGRYALKLDPTGQGLAVEKIASQIDDMLAGWGVKVEDKMVLDPQNQAFPVPVRPGAMQMIQYPFWIDIRSDGMASDSVIVGGLPSVTMQWASPLTVDKQEGVTWTTLLRSTKEAWTQATVNVQPDFQRFPQLGFGRPDVSDMESKESAETAMSDGRMILAASAMGEFTSHYKDKASPLATVKAGATADENPASGSSQVLGTSSPDARLVVFGSSEFLRDEVFQISQQDDRAINNIQLFQNAIDWSLADTDMLSIRSRGTFARTLAPMTDGRRSTWEVVNAMLMIVGLLAVIFWVYLKRKSVHPIDVTTYTANV